MVFTIYTLNMMITIYESNGNIRFFLTHFFRGCQEQPSNPCQVNTLKTGAWFLNIIPTLRSFYMWMWFFWMKSSPGGDHIQWAARRHTLWRRRPEVRNGNFHFLAFFCLLLFHCYFHINLYEVFFKPKSPHFCKASAGLHEASLNLKFLLLWDWKLKSSYGYKLNLLNFTRLKIFSAT